jgi:hypothetical protein
MPQTDALTETPAETRHPNVGDIVWYAYKPLVGGVQNTIDVAPLLITRVNLLDNPESTVGGVMFSLGTGMRFFKAVPFSPVPRHEHWTWPDPDHVPAPVFSSAAEHQAYGTPTPSYRHGPQVDASV